MRFNLPPVTRNFYFIAAVCFLIWMLFIDSNDVLTQIRLKAKQHNLEVQKEYYQQNIIDITSNYDDRNNNNEQIERYAREKYFMKKPTEDLFIVVEEDK